MTTQLLLQNYRILDLSQYIPGPYATRQLADLGADVIKVEPPHGDPMRNFMYTGDEEFSPIYRHLNRGKRIIRLNLKQESGKVTLHKLLSNTDVLLESFRPGVMAKLGFNRDSLKTINPKLIHCALSGFGQNGPYKNRAGHDLTYCAVSGALSNSGTKERPVMSFPPIADHAGAMQACNTILAALLSRERTQHGAFLDISLCESALVWQYLNFHESTPEREKLLLNGGAACYNIYLTADDRFIALAPLETKFWFAFCKAVARPNWIERQFETLPQTKLINELSEMFIKKSLAHWNQLFEDVDCCYEPILLADEVASHPQIKSRQLLKDANPQFPAWINDKPILTDDELQDIHNPQDIDWLA